MDFRTCSTISVLTLARCASLLPTGSSDTRTAFASFDEARAAAERIVAFETRTSQLKVPGFDIEGRNVTLVPYPDIVGRLAPYPGVAMESLDAGVGGCIRAQAACRGYIFHFERQDRRREGNFWLDFLNIRRVTNVKGWWFDALVVESGGTVLFTALAGKLVRIALRGNPTPWARSSRPAKVPRPC